MGTNTKAIKPARTPGTLEGIKLGETLDEFEKRVGDDCPEWTAEDFARARPMREMFPEIVEAFERARRELDQQTGPEEKPSR